MRSEGFPSIVSDRVYFRRHVARDNRQNGLEALRRCLKLSVADDTSAIAPVETHLDWVKSWTEPVFVSVDTEGHPMREIGISILDTRNLDAAAPFAQLSTLISSHNFRTWKCKNAEDEKPFRFGRSVKLQSRWKGWLMKKVLETGSPDMSVTEPRNVILVGHAIVDDLHNFATARKGKFRITDHPTIPIFDTQHLAHGDGDPRSLLDILIETKVPFANLHNGGNDAHYTLKLLLLIAVNSCQGLELTSAQEARRDLLKALGGMELPFRPAGLKRRDLALETASSPYRFCKGEGDWFENCVDEAGWGDCLDIYNSPGEKS
ncbi:hypothetical protein ONS95_013235 [Cadophora gregata]|uniref:uncharacterized protein n=1 Tax=Cadophora gregata TaxID=51156 RepID=UPI0026DBCEBA|nr:uncharacterized protein ONS95_013235 [Cadophora gregata]KAK0099942.1 hypothetical protein ONS96_007888 [Cadophora gregata f. sp. sojae]KAK0116206.1 hypothetical protein ONS95_013235 [Cadophora gregata]